MKDQSVFDVGYYDPATCVLEDFIKTVQRDTRLDDVPFASNVERNVPIYDMVEMGHLLQDDVQRRAVMQEWASVLLDGAGAVALRNAYSDTAALDQATEIYEQIIVEEKQVNAGGGDHFAASGANDRIWNSLQKLCERSPDVFLNYFANVPIATVCEAWLGPGFQMTAQVNVVHPGGAAQQAHRDYHLGFRTAEESASYPAHVHALSPVLTLQGAIAHCDMPVESGPTKLLPFSQTYRPGYAAWRRDDFRAYFEQHCIQLALRKGDALFFNPALFHAAGENRTADVHRMANLLQISSAFGRAMESVDRTAMCKALFPKATAALAQGRLGFDEISAAVACTAEGYAFPTNLDSDPPVGGLAPESQAQFFLRALREETAVDAFCNHLDEMDAKRRP